MPESGKKLDQLCVNTIRMLAVDMVEKANSGHPGMPLGAAGMAYVLFSKFMRHNPANPDWSGRDRFILSAGHGSALLYAMLHLTGYDLSLDELKNFRQWGSKTAGHPEYGLAPGVEATTGPLGQGFAMGVGMALAQRFLEARHQAAGSDLMEHYTYAIVSDGDLMEGVASEAASLAGTLGLGKLIYLYDDNHISIEGGTDLAFTEDVEGRFKAYGWQVLKVADGNDLEAIEAAVCLARSDKDRPSLVMVNTHIGYGSPKVDSASSHGEPLGKDAMPATKEYFGWPTDQPFYIPEDALEQMRLALKNGQLWEEQWNQKLADFKAVDPQAAETLISELAGEMPTGWQKALPVFTADDGPMATRASSGKVINSLAPVLPNLVGGSADLAPSNKTMIAGSGDMRAKEAECGRNIHFGVREHAMGAIINGMALHKGVLPYAGTFFVFSDFMRPSLRLAALMQTNSTFIFTHDSLGVGEDGPTHQPVEHLMSLRLMPGLSVVRPADANETAAAWKLALEKEGPVAMCLTRQKLPVLDTGAENLAKGAYVLKDSLETPEIVLMASGSEVHLALEAAKELESRGKACRVVSMPCWEVFSEQSQEYQDQVLLPQVKAKVAIEAGVTLGWERYVGREGRIIGVDRFGASAPGSVVFKELGLSVENVVNQALSLLG